MPLRAFQNVDGIRQELYPQCQHTETWQRDGFESFGDWRRADQKRRDDAKRRSGVRAGTLEECECGVRSTFKRWCGLYVENAHTAL